MNWNADRDTPAETAHSCWRSHLEANDGACRVPVEEGDVHRSGRVARQSSAPTRDQRDAVVGGGSIPRRTRREHERNDERLPWLGHVVGCPPNAQAKRQASHIRMRAERASSIARLAASAHVRWPARQPVRLRHCRRAGHLCRPRRRAPAAAGSPQSATKTIREASRGRA